MRFIGNVLWLLFGGFFMALGYALAALVMFVLIVAIIGIPFAVAHVKLAGAALWPFGREIVPLSSYPHPSPGIVVSR